MKTEDSGRESRSGLSDPDIKNYYWEAQIHAQLLDKLKDKYTPIEEYYVPVVQEGCDKKIEKKSGYAFDDFNCQ